MTDYLRKALKVPQYSQVFESEADFQEDTTRLFKESQGLEERMNKLKFVLECLLQIFNKDDDIRVSFAVFKGF